MTQSGHITSVCWPKVQLDTTVIIGKSRPEEHRPLGNIERSHKEAYRQSSILRHKANNQVRKEPKNTAEVFDN
jgi:hypothetical protein